MEDLQNRCRLVLAFAAPEVDGDRAFCGKSGDAPRVRKRLSGRECVPIGGRKAAGEARQRVFGLRLGGCFPQRVVPGPHDVADCGLQFGRADIRRFSAGTADDEVDARETAFRESGVEGGEPALEGRPQIVADLLADARIVTVARHEDDHRDEAIELVDAEQRAHARPLAKRQDRVGVLLQNRHRHLEQLVARIGFQHADERLAGMVGRIEARAGENGARLRAQERDLQDRMRVGGGGEEADDAQFANQLPGRIELLDPDIVEIDAPVHERFRVGLGDDQRIGPLEEGADFRRRAGAFGIPPEHEDIGIAQDAQSRRGGTCQRRAVPMPGIVERAHAQEGEIVVAQPLKERGCLRDYVRLERDHAASKAPDR